MSYRTSRGHPPIPGIRPLSPSISLTVLPISIWLGWSVVLSRPYSFTRLQRSIKRSFSSGMSSDWQAVEICILLHMLTVIIPTDHFPTYHQPPPNKREMKKNGSRTGLNQDRTAQNQITVWFGSVRVRPNGANFANRFSSSSHKFAQRTEPNRTTACLDGSDTSIIRSEGNETGISTDGKIRHVAVFSNHDKVLMFAVNDIRDCKLV